MALRVTEADVRAIITTNKTDIDAFIQTANTIVDSNLLNTEELTPAVLKEIERWLSAHLIAIAEPGLGALVEDAVGESRRRYAERGFADGLKATRYGQQVLALDTSGKLAALARRRATFRVVDTELQS